MKKDNRFLEIHEGINISDINNDSTHMRGHVIFRDAETQEIIHEEDNLVLLRTRVWLFEQLFNIAPPSTYRGIKRDNNRSLCLFSIGSGGADLGASAFTPFTPKFNDKELSQPIPFETIDPDKVNNSESQSNPSIVTSLSTEQSKTYYMYEKLPDGTTPYFAKRFKGATDENPLGVSRKWVLDQNTGSVAFSLTLSVDRDEARGTIFNEIGLWLARFNPSTNTYMNPELASRLTFDSESLSSLTKSIDIEYMMYI